MAKTFLELTRELAEAKTLENKTKITEILGRSLEEDEKYTERLLRTFFTSSLVRIVGSGFQDISRSDFYSTRVRAYFDDDFSTRIAIGISYLQDSSQYIEDLDERVLKAISEEIASRNLDFLINDISVNELQLRNGKRVTPVNR